MPRIVDILRQAYVDEIETVANYLALSVALDGVKAEEVKEKLAEDVAEELEHARRLAHRLKEIGDLPPGSLAMRFHQSALQPPERTTDVHAVVRGVLQAEETAVRTYRELVTAAREGDDPVTENLAVEILADEEKHQTLFRGYLKELEETQARREPSPVRQR